MYTPLSIDYQRSYEKKSVANNRITLVSLIKRTAESKSI